MSAIFGNRGDAHAREEVGRVLIKYSIKNGVWGIFLKVGTIRISENTN